MTPRTRVVLAPRGQPFEDRGVLAPLQSAQEPPRQEGEDFSAGFRATLPITRLDGWVLQHPGMTSRGLAPRTSPDDRQLIPRKLNARRLLAADHEVDAVQPTSSDADRPTILDHFPPELLIAE